MHWELSSAHKYIMLDPVFVARGWLTPLGWSENFPEDLDWATCKEQSSATDNSSLFCPLSNAKAEDQDLFEVPPLLPRVSLSLISWVWLLVSLCTSQSSLKKWKSMQYISVLFKKHLETLILQSITWNPNFAVYYLCKVHVRKPETSLGKKNKLSPDVYLDFCYFT